MRVKEATSLSLTFHSNTSIQSQNLCETTAHSNTSELAAHTLESSSHA